MTAANSAHAAILVIDDEQDMREMLAFELSQEGFEVTTAGGGEAAIEAIRRHKFDLAVTDLKMPGMDGIETVAALKRADPDIEVIVATGYATVETAVACIRSGAYDYIRKPYDLQDLLALLSRALERSSLQGSVALFEASRVLLGTLKHSDLVQAVIAPATRIFGADGVGLLLSGPEAMVREPRIGGGALPPGPEVLDYLSRLAAEATTPLRVPAPLASAPEELRGAGYGSALIYRLVSREVPLGTLALLRREGAVDFAASELQRGSVFASQVAMALDNARLYSALDDRVRELLATRDKLVRSEKLAVASKLAGGVAHEINNPLGAMKSNLGALHSYSLSVRGLWAVTRTTAAYLRDRTDADAVALRHQLDDVMNDGGDVEIAVSDIHDVVDETLEAARRIGDLIHSFTQMAGSLEGPRAEAPLDLSALLHECIAVTVDSARSERALFVCDVPPGLATFAVLDDLRIALMNLLGFACEQEAELADDGRGRVEVTADLHGDVPNIRIAVPHLRVPIEQRAQLFDPRIEVRGSRGRTLRLDIRLPVAHQLLDRSGATLSVDECEGGGLELRIELAPVEIALDRAG